VNRAKAAAARAEKAAVKAVQAAAVAAVLPRMTTTPRKSLPVVPKPRMTTTPRKPLPKPPKSVANAVILKVAGLPADAVEEPYLSNSYQIPPTWRELPVTVAGADEDESSSSSSSSSDVGMGSFNTAASNRTRAYDDSKMDENEFQSADDGDGDYHGNIGF
jgi:hypothetical protein